MKDELFEENYKCATCKKQVYRLERLESLKMICVNCKEEIRLNVEQYEIIRFMLGNFNEFGHFRIDKDYFESEFKAVGIRTVI